MNKRSEGEKLLDAVILARILLINFPYFQYCGRIADAIFVSEWSRNVFGILNVLILVFLILINDRRVFAAMSMILNCISSTDAS